MVDELIVAFTHTIEMPWFLPGVAPTEKRVELPLFVIVGFRDAMISHESLYWDYDSVLSQVGVVSGAPTVPGVESAERLAEWAGIPMGGHVVTGQ